MHAVILSTKTAVHCLLDPSECFFGGLLSARPRGHCLARPLWGRRLQQTLGVCARRVPCHCDIEFHLSNLASFISGVLVMSFVTIEATRRFTIVSKRVYLDWSERARARAGGVFRNLPRLHRRQGGQGFGALAWLSSVSGLRLALV